MTPKAVLQTIRPHLKDANFIRELTAHLEAELDQPERLSCHTLQESLRLPDLDKIKPDIRIEGRTILCDGRKLDLSNREKIFDLFEVFIKSSICFVTRAELLDLLYFTNNVAQHSSRLQSSYNNNLIKLLSRSRIAAVTHFGAKRTIGLEWFVYDSERDGWYFYRISNPYRRQLVPR